jgi:hypothetical protein
MVCNMPNLYGDIFSMFDHLDSICGIFIENLGDPF